MGQPHGKYVEAQIRRALEQAGCDVRSSLWLDLRQKIDIFILAIDGRKIQGGLGIQVTTREDRYLFKARVAKLNALKLCRWFVFLILRCSQPDFTAIGIDLKKLLMNLVDGNRKHRALLIRLGQRGELTVQHF